MVYIHLPLIGFLIVSFMMLLLWFYQLKSNNAGVIDIGWALGLVILAGIYAAGLPGYKFRESILFFMVFIWGFRLSGLLVNRFRRDAQEDRRYQKLRQDWGKFLQLKFLALFLFEGLLDLVLSVPFFLICLNPNPQISVFEWIAVGVWIVAFAGEVISDEQMRRFKKEQTNRNKVCQVGLWNYSRHPNYFFEWCMWLAYSLLALSAPHGWMGLISPVIMYHFLINVTGVPLAEEMALRSKGEEYRRYQITTSFFVPLPKRKGNV